MPCAAYQEEAAHKSDFERGELNKEKTGVRLEGIEVMNPVTHKALPMFVSDYVLMGYGTGIVMGVPGHDQRDWEFATKFGLPIAAVDEFMVAARAVGARITGIHAHLGSGIGHPKHWRGVYAELAAVAARHVSEPFDLGRGPLLRAEVLRLAPDHHVLVLTGHHIVLDGWSFWVLVKDLAAACRDGAASATAPSFADYAQSRALGDATPADDLAWWASRFADGGPLLDLPLDRPRPAAR